jgi:probable HAF family extracellular repeat protein
MKNLARMITGFVALAAVILPFKVLAQDEQEKNSHHRYKLVDLGTFGGPNSFINFEGGAGPGSINKRGMAVGNADTSIALTPQSNGYPCGEDPTVPQAMEFNNGSVINLGALVPNACSNSQSINAAGDSVGNSENGIVDPVLGINEIHAVLWSGGHIKDLGTLGGTLSAAGSLNNIGQVTGWALNATPDPFSMGDLFFFGSASGTQTRAFLWRNGVMSDLGTLGGPDSLANDINDRGQVAGMSYTNSVPDPVTGIPTLHPFLWENGRMKDLITDPSVTIALENGMTGNGKVIGVFDSPDHSTTHPFLWDRGVFTDLGTFGGTQGNANRANDAGEVVGDANYPGDVIHRAALWKDGRIKDLGVVTDDKCSTAWGINSQGQIVGVSGMCGIAVHAFLWENGAMLDLNSLIPPGTQLTYAVQISDAGEIACLGHSNGDARDVHAFLLIPASDNDDINANEDTHSSHDTLGQKTFHLPAHGQIRRPHE